MFPGQAHTAARVPTMSHTATATPSAPPATSDGIAREMIHAAASADDRSVASVRVAALAPRRPVEVQPASPVHTPRFSLRPLEVRDREEFLRVLRISDHLDRFMPLRHPGERDEAVFARHLAQTRNSDASGVAWRRVGVDHTGRIVGGFNLINIERGLAHRADANWWVAGDCLRRRVATECVYAMLDLALGDAPLGLGLHEVAAHVQLENEPSLRLVARVGLRDCGEAPQTLRVGERWLLHRTYIKSVLDRA